MNLTGKYMFDGNEQQKNILDHYHHVRVVSNSFVIYLTRTAPNNAVFLFATCFSAVYFSSSFGLVISDFQDCNHCLQNPKYTSPACVRPRATEKCQNLGRNRNSDEDEEVDRCASERAGCAALSSFFLFGTNFHHHFFLAITSVNEKNVKLV